ncbi:chemotaxis protein CheW [uncultured Clostridium sp.]|uniref:chemotaxis protein CheW n=1 Tax=uncultured Clostridium sp. TaxID=59620 RepID=UPI0032164418
MAEEFKLLIFRLGEQCFAADIREVERILNYEEPTKIPDSQDFLEGVINYQDGILPVISLAKKFGIYNLENKEKNGSIVVARNEDGAIGIIVEAVNEVISMSLDDLEDTPDISSNISKRYVKGIVKDKNKNTIILLLNLNELLSKDEKEQIER